MTADTYRPPLLTVLVGFKLLVTAAWLLESLTGLSQLLRQHGPGTSAAIALTAWALLRDGLWIGLCVRILAGHAGAVTGYKVYTPAAAALSAVVSGRPLLALPWIFEYVIFFAVFSLDYVRAWFDGRGVPAVPAAPAPVARVRTLLNAEAALSINPAAVPDVAPTSPSAPASAGEPPVRSGWVALGSYALFFSGAITTGLVLKDQRMIFATTYAETNTYADAYRFVAVLAAAAVAHLAAGLGAYAGKAFGRYLAVVACVLPHVLINAGWAGLDTAALNTLGLVGSILIWVGRGPVARAAPGSWLEPGAAVGPLPGTSRPGQRPTAVYMLFLSGAVTTLWAFSSRTAVLAEIYAYSGSSAAGYIIFTALIAAGLTHLAAGFAAYAGKAASGRLSVVGCLLPGAGAVLASLVPSLPSISSVFLTCAYSLANLTLGGAATYLLWRDRRQPPGQHGRGANVAGRHGRGPGGRGRAGTARAESPWAAVANPYQGKGAAGAAGRLAPAPASRAAARAEAVAGAPQLGLPRRGEPAPPLGAGGDAAARPPTRPGTAVPQRAIAARFQAVELIGEGSSARVYRAFDPERGAAVALKVLSPHLDFDVISLERFRREIQITREIGHPQIVSMYDLSRDGESYYIVMEYIEGLNLGEHIKLHAPVPVPLALALVRELLGILAVCHAKAVVHRDLKPQNIMVMPDGHLRLLDFGVARMTTLSDLTQTGSTLGTPEYMAPELFAANVYDPRSDLYAVGILLFETLAGRLPFQADTLAELFRAHTGVAVPSLRAARPDVPEWVDDLIRRLTAKTPFERYQAAQEALIDLDAERVALRAPPRLKRRACLHCGERTLADMPWCVLCGHAALAAGDGAGEMQVTLSASAAWPDVRRLVLDAFGVTLPLAAAGGALLLDGIDYATAAGLKTLAQSYAVFLTVKPRQQPHWAAVFLSGALMIVMPPASLIFSILVVNNARLDTYGPGDMLVLLGLPTLGTYVAWRVFKGLRRVPLLPLALLAGSRAADDLLWLRELTPYLRAARTESMQAFVAQLVERYILLARAVRGSLPRAEPLLRELLGQCARLAPLVSKLEILLSGPRVRELCELHAQLGARLAAGPDAVLLGHLGETARELEAYARYEDRFAALQNRLAYCQFVFNSLLGKVLLADGRLGSAELERLEAGVLAFKEDEDVARAVDAELAEAA